MLCFKNSALAKALQNLEYILLNILNSRNFCALNEFCFGKSTEEIAQGNPGNPIVGEEGNTTTKWEFIKALRSVPKEAFQKCFKQELYWSNYTAYLVANLNDDILLNVQVLSYLFCCFN